jgi:hypothetical protein
MSPALPGCPQMVTRPAFRLPQSVIAYVWLPPSDLRPKPPAAPALRRQCGVALRRFDDPLQHLAPQVDGIWVVDRHRAIVVIRCFECCVLACPTLFFRWFWPALLVAPIHKEPELPPRPRCRSRRRRQLKRLARALALRPAKVARRSSLRQPRLESRSLRCSDLPLTNQVPRPIRPPRFTSRLPSQRSRTYPHHRSTRS